MRLPQLILQTKQVELHLQIESGVKAYDLKSGEKLDAEVEATKNGIGNYHYVINDGIKVTPPHPFFTADNRWVEIKNLKEGQDQQQFF